MTITVSVIVLIACMMIGVTVPMAFIAASATMILLGGYDSSFMAMYSFSNTNSLIILTIPLFVIAGSLMEKGGIGENLINFIQRFVGTIKGSLCVVTVVACAIFGAISGSSGATLTSIGGIMAPQLKNNGYPSGIVGALVASSGILGILIPPSTLMILYAWCGGQSVLASFLAAAVPGVMLVILLSIVSVLQVRKCDTVKVYTKEELRQKLAEDKAERKRKKEAGAIPAIIMPVIMLGSIYGGFLTTTEAAALSVIYALPVGIFIYKRLNWKTTTEALRHAGQLSGIIIIMIFTVTMLSRMYVNENLPQTVLHLLLHISDNYYVLLLIVNIFMIICGMLMDDMSSILLVTPILLPVVTALGMNPIQFAAVIAVNVGMGNITPPVAPLLYLSGKITGAEVKDMLKPTMQLICFAWLPVLLLVTYFPKIVLWLPALFGYI